MAGNIYKKLFLLVFSDWGLRRPYQPQMCKALTPRRYGDSHLSDFFCKFRVPDLTMITARQIRAAGALLGWTQQRLADAAIVSFGALTRLERGEVNPRLSTISAVQTALVKAGIEFIPAGDKGEGVRLAKPQR
jgi:DNA-binding XRE family transcriptional regulator